MEPASLEDARRGDVLYLGEADVAPGRYVVEVAAHDAVSDSSSVVVNDLEAPDSAAEGLRMSSLMLVRRAEEQPPGSDREGPLTFGSLLLYPNLGEPVFERQAPLGFGFKVYGAAARPQSAVEISQPGRILASMPLPLPSPDSRGHIAFAGTLPLGHLPPGRYALRVSVSDGQTSVSRTAPFFLTVAGGAGALP